MDLGRKLLDWYSAFLNQLEEVRWSLILLTAVAFLQFFYFDIAV